MENSSKNNSSVKPLLIYAAFAVFACWLGKYFIDKTASKGEAFSWGLVIGIIGTLLLVSISNKREKNTYE